MAEKVKAEVQSRFNHNDPGDVIEVTPENFKKWEGMGLLKKTDKPLGRAADKAKADAKAAEGPPQDKAIKEPEKKK